MVFITNSHQARTEVTGTIKNITLNDKVIKSIDANNSENLFSNYLRALHAEKNSDVLSAAKFYTESLAIDNTNPKLLQSSFTNLYATGQIIAAAKIAQHAESLNFNLNMGVEPALAIAAKDSDWEAVLALSEIAMLEGSSQYIGFLFRAWAMYNLDQKSSAITFFEILSKLLDDQGFEDSNFVNLFVAQLFILEKDHSQAITYLSKILLEESSDPELIITTAETYAFAGRVKTAQLLVQKLPENYKQINLNSWLEERAKVEISKKHSGYFLAQSIINLTLYTLTEETFSSLQHRAQLSLFLAHSLGFSLPSANLVMLQLSKKKNNFKNSNFYFDSIPEEDLRFQTGMMLYLSQLRQLDKTVMAIDLLQTYLSKNTDNLMLEEMLADFFRINEQCDKAIKKYENVSKLKANSGDVFRKLGICYEQTDQTQKAETAFGRALELNPNDSGALNYLGYWWADEGRNLKEAMELITKAVQLYPENGYYADSLGWVYFKIGNTKKAVTWLERAVELAPDDAVIHDHLGDVYWHLGRLFEARYKWQFAYQMYTDKMKRREVSEKKEDGELTETHTKHSTLSSVTTQTRITRQSNRSRRDGYAKYVSRLTTSRVLLCSIC